MEAGAVAERVVAQPERRLERSARDRPGEPADFGGVGLAGLGGRQRRGDVVGLCSHRIGTELAFQTRFRRGAFRERVGFGVALLVATFVQRDEVVLGALTGRAGPTGGGVETATQVTDLGDAGVGTGLGQLEDLASDGGTFRSPGPREHALRRGDRPFGVDQCQSSRGVAVGRALHQLDQVALV
jgi:hypothetical protein